MMLALIPPLSLKRQMDLTQLHLLLPELMRKYSGPFAPQLTGYRILDNGAAEGVTASVSVLQRWAEVCDEIVAPDRLNDMSAALAGAQDMKFFPRFYHSKRRKFMAVVQGVNLVQCRECYEAFLDMDWIDVIALPRIMNFNFGKTGRMDFMDDAAHRGQLLKPIHFLGSRYDYPGEIRDAAMEGHVRSMDTSLPYVAGAYNISLDGDTFEDERLEGVTRPEGYFDEFVPNERQREVIKHNVTVCVRWSQWPHPVFEFSEEAS